MMLHEYQGRDHWHNPDREKTCIICGDSKPVADFYAYGYNRKDGTRGTRYESRCMPCARQRRIEAYQKNPEADRASNREWCEKNQDALKEYRRTKQKCPEHRSKKAFNQRLRKARARSGSGDNAAIRKIYQYAKEVQAIVSVCPVFDIPELGKEMQVDHIMPLSRGGQHHENNLQVLPKGINMRKGSKCPK